MKDRIKELLEAYYTVADGELIQEILALFPKAGEDGLLTGRIQVYEGGRRVGRTQMLVDEAIAEVRLECEQKLKTQKALDDKRWVEELTPRLRRIGDLVCNIRSDWADPRTECREIMDILSEIDALKSKITEVDSENQ